MDQMNSEMFDWTYYSKYATVIKLNKNAILFNQGDQLNGFYYLKKGKIMISVLRADGYERIIDFACPGTLIGEQMIHNRASFTTAKAHITSTLLYFSKDQFKQMSKEYPEASDQFGYSLIRKIRMLAEVNTILNAPVETQLAHFLLNLCMKTGNKDIDLSQTILSKYIGKSRVSVWKVLKEWKNTGIIKIKNQSFIINDVEKLKNKLNG